MTEVLLVKTDDRIKGMKAIFSHYKSLFEALKDKRVAIKPNFNTADPPPASTDIEIIRELIIHLKNCKAKKITVVERSGPVDTHETMVTKGILTIFSGNISQIHIPQPDCGSNFTGFNQGINRCGGAIG